MGLRITIPENIGDITLEQYQKYHEVLQRDLSDYETAMRKIAIFTELTFQQAKNLRQIDFEEVSKKISEALNVEVQFKQTFSLNMVEYGFIPNLDKISMGEFADLSKYGTDVPTLHNLMAILFRPVIDKDYHKNYKIADYNGTEETAIIMKKMSLNIVNGALFFFANLSEELTNYTQRYLTTVQQKVKLHHTILTNGDGTQPSMN